MLLIRTVREMFRLSKICGVLAVVMAVFYLLQFLFRIELTPLGYFSLYSDPTPALPFYSQALPSDEQGKPINIYRNNGSSFLMYEILPTRYEILSGSEACNQMGYKLRQFGIELKDTADCVRLRQFDAWFSTYAHRTGLGRIHSVKKYGFLDGKLIHVEDIP